MSRGQTQGYACAPENVDEVVKLKLTGADNESPKLYSVLDSVAGRFKAELNEDEQIKCKSAIKNYVRSYQFLSAIMPYESAEWECLYEFYSLLVRKLPKLKIVDFAEGVLADVDFDKYRIIEEEERAIKLDNSDKIIDPVPVGSGGNLPQPDMQSLSSIIQEFNETFGNIQFKNEDEVQRQIEELPVRIMNSKEFINAVKNGDSQVAQITFNDSIVNIVAAMLEEKTEFVQAYFANQDFQNFVNSKVFQAAMKSIK